MPWTKKLMTASNSVNFWKDASTNLSDDEQSPVFAVVLPLGILYQMNLL